MGEVINKVEERHTIGWKFDLFHASQPTTLKENHSFIFRMHHCGVVSINNRNHAIIH